MLIRFWVSGYRCFRQRTGLDFTDKKNYRFGADCVRGDFLDKVVIMGNNGAGKTSFGYAITDIVSTLAGFVKDVGQNDPLCFANGSMTPTFHYEFSCRGSSVVYEYSKSAPGRMVAESLTIDRTTVFSYDLSDGSHDVFELERMGVPGSAAPVPDGSVPLLRMLHESGAIRHDCVARDVLAFARNSIYYMAMWKTDVHIGFLDEEDDVEGYIVNNGLLEEFNRFLDDQCGIRMTVRAHDDRLFIDAGGREIPFFKAASRGTAILCRLFCWNRRSGSKRALMFFDDFDDLFDHRTAENVMTHIIRKSQAQCVFITHNVGLISSDTLRPDCCFIMHRGGLDSLANLTDKNIRRGNNLEKMLRDGEFSVD